MKLSQLKHLICQPCFIVNKIWIYEICKSLHPVEMEKKKWKMKVKVKQTSSLIIRQGMN